MLTIGLSHGESVKLGNFGSIVLKWVLQGKCMLKSSHLLGQRISVARLCYVKGVACQFWQLAFIMAIATLLPSFLGLECTWSKP